MRMEGRGGYSFASPAGARVPDISSVPSIKCRQALLPPPQASPWGPPQGDPEVGWAALRPALRALLPNTQAAVWGEGRVNGSPLAQSPFLVLVRPAQPLWPLSGLIYWGREPHHHVLSCPERMSGRSRPNKDGYPGNPGASTSWWALVALVNPRPQSVLAKVAGSPRRERVGPTELRAETGRAPGAGLSGDGARGGKAARVVARGRGDGTGGSWVAEEPQRDNCRKLPVRSFRAAWLRGPGRGGPRAGAGGQARGRRFRSSGLSLGPRGFPSGGRSPNGAGKTWESHY